jgi:hypothetical protein
VENLLRAGRFAADKENLLLYKSIATMDRGAPVPKLRTQSPNWAAAAKLARDWELNQLAKRLDQLAASAAATR